MSKNKTHEREREEFGEQQAKPQVIRNKSATKLMFYVRFIFICLTNYHNKLINKINSTYLKRTYNKFGNSGDEGSVVQINNQKMV